MVAHIPEALVVHQDEDDVWRLLLLLLVLLTRPLEVIAAVVPRRVMVAPRPRDDEAQQQAQRKPRDQHVARGFGAPDADAVSLLMMGGGLRSIGRV